MSEPFDPYVRWLGIRDPKRPPNHYRLLGVELFESDPDVLSHAADRQMAHVRTFQSGKHSAESQALLNELAAAKICLLDPDRKAEYDARLRAEYESTKAPPLPPSATEPPPLPPPEASSISAVSKLPPVPPPVAPKPPEPPKSLPVPPPVTTAVSASPVEVDALPHIAEAGPGTLAARRRPRRALRAVKVLASMILMAGGLIALLVIGKEQENQAEPPELTAGKTEKTEKTESTSVPESNSPGPKTPGLGPPEPKTPASETREPKTAPPDPREPKTPAPDVPEPVTPEPEAPGPKAPGAELPEPGPSAPPEDLRHPVPTPPMQVAMIGEIRRVFSAEYALAREQGRHQEAARRLLAAAQETQDDLVARYVLFTEARDQAMAAGDTETFRSAIESIGKEYVVDPLLMTAETLHDEARKSRTPAADRAMARLALSLVGDACARDDFQTAKTLAEAARDLARNARDVRFRDPRLTRAAADTIREVEARRRRYERFLQARQTLISQPDDPAANLAAGMHYCFTKHDFRRGLPMLRKGDDPVLAGLAEAEATVPTKAAEMVALADGWYEASARVAPSDRPALLKRAAYWYNKALPGLSGMTQARVNRRLDEIRGQ